MPVALLVAMLASLGLHVTALFGPEIDLAPAPASIPPPLQAEIVLQPRASPVTASAAKPTRNSVRKSRPALPSTVSGGLAQPASPEVSPVIDEVASVSPDDWRRADDGETDNGKSAPDGGLAAAAPESVLESPRLPETGVIRYLVSRGDPPLLIGSAVQRWEMTAGRYRIVSVMETTGVAAWVRAVRIETESSGRLADGGLAPVRYVSRRQDREQVEQVDFDHEAGLIRFGNGRSVALPAGAQDLLSFNFQLGWLARTGDLAIATGRKLGTFRLELLGKEWVETAGQPIWTLHFRAQGETTTEVWLAADKHLLPVKIRHIDKKGERFEQVAQEIRLDPDS